MRRIARYHVVVVCVLLAFVPYRAVGAQMLPVPGPDSDVWARQALIQRVLLAAGAYADMHFPDLYCGLWLDVPNNHGHILLKDTDPAITAEIAASVDHPEILVFDRAKYNEHELMAIRDQIWGDRDLLRAQGVDIAAVGLKTDLDRVLVNVVSKDQATTDLAVMILTGRYGDDTITVSAVAGYAMLA